MPKGGGFPKVKGVGQGDSWVLLSILRMSPPFHPLFAQLHGEPKHS